MNKSIVHKQNLRQLISVKWKGRPVWEYYAQLEKFLTDKVGKDLGALFAEPNIRESAIKGDTDAQWFSDRVSAKAQRLENLSAAEQTHYKNLLKQQINKLSELAYTLLEEPEKNVQEWGELILKCVEIPDANCILVENEHIVLVAWGFKMTTLSEQFNLVKVLGIKTEKSIEPSNNPELSQNENQLLPQQELDKDSPPSDQQETPPAVVPEEKTTVIPIIADTPPTQPPSATPQKPWWKAPWFWLLLLLLLLLLLWWFFSKGNSNYLPEKPRTLIPIDSTTIIDNEEGTHKIVSNRLNVSLRANKDVKAFAKRFKELYASDAYKIIYYDSTTHRLQLEVPEGERSALKKKLKEQMPEFKLLIWEENMFESREIPADPAFSQPNQSWYYNAIRAYQAWDISKGNPDVVIAILDDGFDLSHPELASKVVKPKNIPANNAQLSFGTSFHGTHVAGTALGLANNRAGGAGLARDCAFMPVQVGDRYGRMSSTAIIDAVLYAIENNANVINMSLGIALSAGFTNAPEAVQERMAVELFQDEAYFWNDLFQTAHEKNITVVLAGGNSNAVIGLDPMQRSPYTINVSATDPQNQKAPFSNYGRRSTLSAPGVDIYSSTPQGKFGFSNGTSMAAPVVAGVVGLMKSVNPALPNADIVDILQSTGIPVLGSQRMGNLIQADAALRVAAQIRNKMPTVDCPDAQQRIDSLLRQIELIREECDQQQNGDTLKLPIGENNNTLDFAKGIWKSSTPIFNNQGEKVTIYFDLNGNTTGALRLREPNNTTCTAPLNLNFSAGVLTIDQTSAALCNPPPKSYVPYTFQCTPDEYGHAECTASNKSQTNNFFRFNLIRVNPYQ